jgi:hypothetical protein
VSDPWKADREALAGDWQAVGGDLWTGIKKVLEEEEGRFGHGGQQGKQGKAMSAYVPGHEAQSRLRVKLAIPIWPLLPGRVQGWLCGCATCRASDR